MFYKVPNYIEVESVSENGSAVLGIYTKNGKEYAKVKYTKRKREDIRNITSYLDRRYKESLKNAVPRTIDEFIATLTKGKYWTEDATDGIKIYFGYEDGDMSKLNPVVFNEQDKPHMFIGGITGGGKSVLLSAAMNVLKATYSPKDVCVWYYDFKKVEAGLHAKPYKWSHCSCISGSETSDYVITVMRRVKELMEEQYSAIQKAGCNNLSGYLRKLRNIIAELRASGDNERADYIEVRLPQRIVFIVDEYMAGLNKGEEAKQEMLKTTEDILSLGRAAGLHMLALSQSPPKGLPDSLYNLFAIRGCTKATKDVSVAVLGNDFASRQENQILGFMGVNDNLSREEIYNKMYLVPLSLEKQTFKYSKITYDMADEICPEYKRTPVVYSEIGRAHV